MEKHTFIGERLVPQIFQVWSLCKQYLLRPQATTNSLSFTLCSLSIISSIIERLPLTMSQRLVKKWKKEACLSVKITCRSKLVLHISVSNFQYITIYTNNNWCEKNKHGLNETYLDWREVAKEQHSRKLCLVL